MSRIVQGRWLGMIDHMAIVSVGLCQLVVHGRVGFHPDDGGPWKLC